jgi:hypothetical protein
MERAARNERPISRHQKKINQRLRPYLSQAIFQKLAVGSEFKRRFWPMSGTPLNVCALGTDREEEEEMWLAPCRHHAYCGETI